MAASHAGFYHMQMIWSSEKTREQLQAVHAVVQQALEEWGMQRRISKTKYM